MGPMAKFFEKLKILAENPEVKEILKDMENEKTKERRIESQTQDCHSPKSKASSFTSRIIEFPFSIKN